MSGNSTVAMDNAMSLSDDTPSTWMLVNGSAKAGQSTLDEKVVAPFEGHIPPTGPANTTLNFQISQTDPVVWVVNKAPYTEAKVPIIKGPMSDGWNLDTTYHLPYNKTVDIIMNIAQGSMDTVSSLCNM